MTHCLDEILTLSVLGRTRTAVVRAPETPLPGGALLINLALDRRTTLDVHPYGLVPAIFLAAGHRVATFDMPRHGEDAVDGLEGLPGMAAACARGEDVFTELRATASALIDACVARGWAQPGRLVVSGTSRGGHAALHVLAGEARVLAAAAMAPVTHLPALWEFAALADSPIIQRSNAAALVPHLADRRVLLVMGETDPRVDAAPCFDLYARLRAAGRQTPPALFTLPGATHGDAVLEPGYHAMAAFLLQACAEAMK